MALIIPQRRLNYPPQRPTPGENNKTLELKTMVGGGRLAVTVVGGGRRLVIYVQYVIRHHSRHAALEFITSMDTHV